MEMEVVLGSGEEAKPKDCSSENESAKELDSGEKTLENDVGQENGVRVSENGEKKSDVDGEENGVRVSENGEKKSGDGEDEETKEIVVETEKVNESGGIEDCVMNGVSSLLKLKQDVSDKEEEEIDEDEEEDGEDDDDEEEEEEEHGYYVGDFVWGKIKNHPWWPGQIYEPSEASDLALKIKQKGKLLVAYFGDGTFAWCGASQLKPFAESFKDCSKMSNSRSFVGAVEEAVEEMGRHIERLLICDCAEEKPKFDNPVANNAGIKEGVFVRDVRREMISSLLVGKHGEILRDVRCFAETVSFSSLLELEILKRKVSAFYRSKRGYGLTEYHEPQSVPGLEDKNNDDDDGEDEYVDDGIEWRAKRSSIEEAAFDHGESSVQRSLEKCSGFPDHRLLHRRKEKSIADILENESTAKVRFETEPVDGDEKSNVKSARKKTKRQGEVNGELENATTATPRRRKKSEVSTVEDAGRKQVEESSKSKTLSRRRKKGDVDGGDDIGSVDREESEKNKDLEPEIDIDSTPLASLRTKVRVDASDVEKSTENGETTTQTSKRERKKSKYLSPEFLSDFSSKGRKKSKIESESSKVSSQTQVGEQMTDASDSLVAAEEDKLDKPCEPSLDNGLGREELSNAVDFLRLGATPEEMGDLIRVAALGTQYPKDSSSRDMVREFMTIYRSFTYHEGANHKFLGSYDSSDKVKEELTETGKSKTKGKEIKDKKRKGKQQAEDIEEIVKEENVTGKEKKEQKRKKSESKKLAGEGEETPKELSESTKKEKKRKKKKVADGEEETREEASESTKEVRKRKKRESKKHAEVDKEEETQKESSESNKKERKRKKLKHDEEETRNETVEPEKKKKKKKREGKSKEKETEKEFSGAELFATFGPGSSLPKKEDLIEIYEKFGALDKERTDMIDSNFCARVAFLDVADGEKAFEFSQEKSPFTSASTVKFRLKYPNEKTEEKKTEAEVAETTMVKKKYLKKKLKRMVTLLEECEGEMTEEVYVKFEGKLVNLMEKVRERS